MLRRSSYRCPPESGKIIYGGIAATWYRVCWIRSVRETISMEIYDEDIEGLRICDDLTDFAADLVISDDKNGFVDGLSRIEPGVWAEVLLLCSGVPEVENCLVALSRKWKFEDSCCTIIFFLPDIIWSTVMLFNKSIFQGPVSRRTSERWRRNWQRRWEESTKAES